MGSGAHRPATDVTSEHRPRKAGVVRAMARSCPWWWGAMPPEVRASGQVTFRRHCRTHHARSGTGSTVRAVQSHAGGPNVPGASPMTCQTALTVRWSGASMAPPNRTGTCGSTRFVNQGVKGVIKRANALGTVSLVDLPLS